MKGYNRTRSARLSVVWQQRGASAVEMALVLPILVLLVFGIIEFGAYLYNQQVLTNASREGARAGIIQRETPVSDGEIRSVVNSYASGRMITFGDSGTEPSTDISAPGGRQFGMPLIVTSNYEYSFFVVGSLIPGFSDTRMMSAQTTMLFE
jgi:hypothetical protein